MSNSNMNNVTAMSFGSPRERRPSSSKLLGRQSFEQDENSKHSDEYGAQNGQVSCHLGFYSSLRCPSMASGYIADGSKAGSSQQGPQLYARRPEIWTPVVVFIAASQPGSNFHSSRLSLLPKHASLPSSLWSCFEQLLFLFPPPHLTFYEHCCSSCLLVHH